jgi:site-specific recombinase XerD
MDIKVLANQFYDYSNYFRGYSKPTIKRYRQAILFYCKIAQVETIEQVSNENIKALFFYGRSQRNWKANTFLSYHKSLAVFFNWCKGQGYLTENPVNDIEVPKLDRKLPSKLTKQDAFRLLETVYNYPYQTKLVQYRNHAIFSTFLFAGIRKKELLNLKYTDVDIDNLTLFVNQGKGGKDRIIPVSPVLAQSLQRYLTERKKLNKTCPAFFTSSVINGGLTEISLKRLVAKIRNATGMSFTIHKLRHTFATLMLEGGCDIYSLSKMMGHSDIKTTTIYLAASAEHLRAQMVKHPLNDLMRV